MAVIDCRPVQPAEFPVEAPHDNDRADDPRTDEQLVAAINGGDSAAFEVLYFRHRDWVTSHALRMTGDHALALDVLQETFLYVLRKFPGFRLTARMTTFLFPVVRNLSIAARRKTERAQSSQSELDRLDDTPAAPTVAPDNEALALALDSLSEDHRETLNLRFVDGMTLAEIADALEIPLGTVKSRVHHALRTLREAPGTRHLFNE